MINDKIYNIIDQSPEVPKESVATLFLLLFLILATTELVSGVVLGLVVVLGVIVTRCAPFGFQVLKLDLQ